MGRTARGVRGIRLRAGDEVIDLNKVQPNSYIFVISENGYGKRTKIEQFTAHRRGGVGIKSAVVNDKTGKLVGVRTLSDDADEIIIISRLGQTIRLGLKDISTMSRTTQGVRIMRLNSGDNVAAMALVKEQGEDVDIEEADQLKPKEDDAKTKGSKPKPAGKSKSKTLSKSTKSKPAKPKSAAKKKATKK
jgi:DNA gyrase subunit A